MRRRWVGVALALVAALAYSTWLLAPLLGASLDPMTSYVSELAAGDQPGHWFFRGGDLLAGAAFLALGLVTLGGMRSGTRATWGGSVGLLVLGVATIADSFLPMSCATHGEAACLVAERAGQLPLSHQAHTVVSVTAALGMLTVLSAWTLEGGARLTGSGGVTRLALGGLALVAILAVVVSGVAERLGWPVGLLQRVSLAGFAVWLPTTVWVRSRPGAPSGRAESP